jgi:hypothetical protein
MRALLASLLLLTVTPGAHATRRHELEEASVALVVRPDGLVALRLQLPWATVLQRRMAPGEPMTALLARLVNQPPAAFARVVGQVEAQLERELRLLEARDGAPPMERRFTRWQWPSAATVQGALREELMSRLAEGAAFRHASRLPATAEVQAGQGRGTARLATPALLGPVLLTVTHPVERFLPAGAVSLAFPLRGG